MKKLMICFFLYFIQNLIEFNIVYNRRIFLMVDIGKDFSLNLLKRKYKSFYVNFMEEDEVINLGL